MSHPWADRVARVAVEVADAARAAAGRADHMRRTVDDLRVGPGRVEARVRVDDAAPCAVAVVAPVPGEDEWRAAVDAIVARPALELRVAGGELPVELVGALAAGGLPLVPGPEELDAECTCASADGGCRHVVATLLALADRVEVEPATLLVWRGRTPEALAEAVRGRGGIVQALAAAASAPDEHERALPLDEAFWTGWPAPEPPLVSLDPSGTAAVLDELGAPPEAAGGEDSLARLHELFAGLAPPQRAGS